MDNNTASNTCALMAKAHCTSAVTGYSLATDQSKLVAGAQNQVANAQYGVGNVPCSDHMFKV